MRMIVGDNVTKTPVTFCDYDEETRKQIARPMRGVVFYVHPQGRYYGVEFTMPGGKIRECFKGGDA